MCEDMGCVEILGRKNDMIIGVEAGCLGTTN